MKIKYHGGLKSLTIWDEGDTRHIMPEYRGVVGWLLWLISLRSK